MVKAGTALALVLSTGWMGGVAAMEMDYTSTVTLADAPFGGRALRVEVRSGPWLFRGSVWGRGYADLAAGGSSLLLDNRADGRGSGRGEICREGRPCVPAEGMRLRFERLELRVGGAVYGYLSVRNEGSLVEFPFGGAIR